MTALKGTLYLVPTPIGNMGDITRRAVEVLAEVALVACEDTRHGGRLLKKLDLKKRLLSYHDFNEAGRAQQLLRCLESGDSVAVITDAGSPGISDPAYRVVRMAIDHGIEVVALPGANAVIPALTASGLPCDRFFFEGFLPVKSAARKRRLQQLQELDHTLVFFESPHRLVKTLRDMREVLGDRQACVAREISKLHEELLRGTLGTLLTQLDNRTIRGEIVLVIEGTGLRRKERNQAVES